MIDIGLKRPRPRLSGSVRSLALGFQNLPSIVADTVNRPEIADGSHS